MTMQAATNLLKKAANPETIWAIQDEVGQVANWGGRSVMKLGSLVKNGAVQGYHKLPNWTKQRGEAQFLAAKNRATAFKDDVSAKISPDVWGEIKGMCGYGQRAFQFVVLVFTKTPEEETAALARKLKRTPQLCRQLLKEERECLETVKKKKLGQTEDIEVCDNSITREETELKTGEEHANRLRDQMGDKMRWQEEDTLRCIARVAFSCFGLLALWKTL